MNNIKFDWSICSDWANYVAMDSDGKVCEFEDKPKKIDNNDFWSSNSGKWKCLNSMDNTIKNCWDESLIERPERHVHADLIIAWANGAQIQMLLNNSEWKDIKPTWIPNQKYRIKPDSIKLKYKLATMRTYNNTEYYVKVVNSDSEELHLESGDLFVQWLTDWIKITT